MTAEERKSRKRSDEVGALAADVNSAWLPPVLAGWQLKKLKHLGQVRSGLAKGKKHDSGTPTVELPYMRVANVQDGHIDLTDVALLEVAVDDVSRYSLAVGDVLMNEGGDYDKLGRGAVWEGKISPCLHQNHVFAVRLDDVSLAPWVSALTRTDYAKRYFKDNSKQSTNLASISQSNVKEWSVVVPPPAVRDELLAFLSAETARIDGLIEAKKGLLDSLVELKSVRIAEILTGGADNLVSTDDVWLPRIPKGWTLKRLKHLGQVRSGLAKGKKHDAGTETLELPYMRVANVQDGHIDLSDVATLEVAADDVERYSLAVGDVLMNEGGDYDKLGRGAVWEGKVAPCLHQNHVFAVRLDDVAWAPWVSALTRTAYAKFYFMNNSKQSTNLASISQSNVKEWPVVMPPEDVRDELLEQLVAELKRADDLIEHVGLELKTLAELRAATITDAVLGRIDVREHMKN